LYAAGRRGLSFIALCILALNSKEMAVTLPAVLWIYELIFDPRSLTPRCLFQRNKLALWILTIATPIAIAIKRGPQGAFANNPDYAVHLDAAHFLASTQSWMSQFLLQPDLTLSFTMAAALLLLPLAAGLLFHHKPLLFFGAFVILTPLPVNFIAPRGFFVMYLPLIAWAGSLAIALTALRDRLARPSFPARAILLLSAAALLYYAQSLGFHPRFAMADPSQANNRSLHAALTQHCPSLPSGGHILLRDDPFDPGYWDPLFVARLTYHDKTATLERTKSAAERPLTPGRQYDCTLAFDGSSYKRK
jgi:hypothetical protein